MRREIKGWHVLTGFILAFGVILAVNLTLAYNAIRTFPGLEVKNSYVASQSFDVDRAAQLALAWDVSATLAANQLRLQILQDGTGISPIIESAIFGRATSVVADQQPAFAFDGNDYVAEVTGGRGNWNLRIKLRADDGTLFQQRLIVRVLP
jgi:nitrogen fixation protein FixH